MRKFAEFTAPGAGSLVLLDPNEVSMIVEAEQAAPDGDTVSIIMFKNTGNSVAVVGSAASVYQTLSDSTRLN